jgi:dihydroorotase
MRARWSWPAKRYDDRAMTPTLTLTRPDDWHLHLRDGPAMASVLAHAARQFARAIVMPNLRPPVVTTAQALAYRERILAALPKGAAFAPLMTLYLTDSMGRDEVARAKASGFVHAVKYYPAGATTNSDSGVTSLERIAGTLEAMQEHDLPLLVHGEVTEPTVDVFDREQIFVETVLARIVQRFPALRVVLEHVSTREGAQYVAASGPKVAATITAHHLLYSRNALFSGGIRPHLYCMPVLKGEEHRRALVACATGGSPKFFLGTDSAPHSRRDKESSCGHAGVYSAHAALELYAEAFESAGALERLEAFASFHGPDFYRLPRNVTKVMLRKEPWVVPRDMPFGTDTLVPLRAGESMGWRLS